MTLQSDDFGAEYKIESPDCGYLEGVLQRRFLASVLCFGIIANNVRYRDSFQSSPLFLSSGIDSSLVLALAAKMRPDVIAISSGFPDSLEVENARRFCQTLGVRHEVVELSSHALFARYEEVICHLESFEPNLVRASLISHSLCERARQLGLRVALAGEGADEIFGGYDDFQHLLGDKLECALKAFFSDLHRTQLLRWDKMGMANTVEVRTPFMDQRVVGLAHQLPSSFKVSRSPEGTPPVVKAILREASRGLLPASIWNRVKIPMDDGVTVGGAKQWNDLVLNYLSDRPKATLSNSVREKFAVANEEELVNLSIILRYLPIEFISTKRISVRKKQI